MVSYKPVVKKAAGVAGLLAVSAGVLPLQAAMAAGPFEWKHTPASDDPNGLHYTGGYEVTGILGNGSTYAGAYQNRTGNKSRLAAYCINSGFPASVDDKLKPEPIENTAGIPRAAFAMSMYGDSKNYEMTGAVSAVVHREIDNGTDQNVTQGKGGISGEKRRSQWAEAIKYAPDHDQYDVKNRIKELEQQFANHKKDGKLNITLKKGDGTAMLLDANSVGMAMVDNPNFNPSLDPNNGGANGKDIETNYEKVGATITLTGGKFEDGSRSKHIMDNVKGLKVIPDGGGEYGSSGTVTANIQSDKEIKYSTGKISLFRGSSLGTSNGKYKKDSQTMAFSAPARVTPKGTASLGYDVPPPPPPKPALPKSQASDGKDGDAVVNPEGTVNDRLTIVGLDGDWAGKEAKYRLVTNVTPKDDETKVVASSEKEFTKKNGYTKTKDASDNTPEEGYVDTEVSLKGVPEGEYAVSQTLEYYDFVKKGWRNANKHVGIKEQTQSFTIVKPDIKTTAVDKADKTKFLKPAGGTITDTVKYNGLSPKKEYTMKGVLMDKATGKPVLDENGKEITAEKKFTPTSDSGTVDIEFDVPASETNKRIVVFESVFEGDKEFIIHADINDEDQTVYIPKIGTKASDASDGTRHLDYTAKETVIRDEVAYHDLKVGESYTLKATVMDKATKEPLVGPNGETYTGEMTFTAEDTEGTVTIDIPVDPAALKGKTTVMFEKVMHEEEEVAVHTDINDEGQTVYTPSIGTQLRDQDGDQYVLAKEADGRVLTDTVKYEGLIPGETYRVEGKMMVRAPRPYPAKEDESSSKPAAPAASDAGGAGAPEAPEAQPAPEAPEAPEADNGGVTQEQLDAIAKEVFADAPSGLELAIDSAGNVTFADGTTVRDMGDDGKAEIRHEGEEWNLVIIGDIAEPQTLPLTTDKAIQDAFEAQGAEIGEAAPKDGPLLDAEGKEVVGSTEFVASETGSGTVDIEFKLPDTARGKTLVAFEKVFYGDELVATHENINDEGQTVNVPDGGTKAEDKEDGDKNIIQSGGTVKDTVEYTGLKPNTEYEVSGVLMDKATNKPLTDKSGKEITSKATFTTGDTGSGSVEVEFKLPDTAAGKTLVAFETVSHEGTSVFIHADINDTPQTVYVRDMGTVAAVKGSGGKIAGKGDTIVDTVTYTNFVPGAEYTLEGLLYNKNTGKFVSDEPTTAKFTASESGNGEATVEFVLPEDLPEGNYVVFEKAFDKNKKLVAKHEDKNSKDQTFGYDIPETPMGPRVNTGGEVVDDSGNLGMGIAGALAVVVTGAGVALKRRRVFKVDLGK